MTKPSYHLDKMKSLCLLMFLILTMAAFIGCQNGNQQNNDQISEDSSSEISTDTTSNQNSDYRSIANELGTITAVTDFSEGRAWVSDSTNASVFDGSNVYLINTDGDIVYKHDKSQYDSVGNFSHETALAYHDSTLTRSPMGIINDSGELIWTTEKDGKAAATEFFGPDIDVTDIEIVDAAGFHDYGGYVGVSFKIDTYDFTGTVSGILDSNLNWIVAPMTPQERQSRADYYQNEHLYSLKNPDESGIIYDNYWVELEGEGLVLYRSGEFVPYEGSKPDSFGGRDFIYGGKTKQERALEEEAILTNQLVYNDDETFVNGNGETVIDLSGKGLITGPLSQFVDTYRDSNSGKIVAFRYGDFVGAEMTNKGGGDFFTVIDRSGEFQFEPRRYSSVGEFTDHGVFFIPPDSKTGYFITETGDQLGSETGVNGRAFYDDRAFIKTETDGWHCIDENGEVVF